MTTYKSGDRVERNPAMVPVAQLAQWHREFPGGRRGVVLSIDTQFTERPYHVCWDNGERAYYRADDLLLVNMAAQASLFGEG